MNQNRNTFLPFYVTNNELKKLYIYIYIYIYFHIIKMESKDELEKIHIENHTHYYFGDIMRVWDKDIDFSDILLEKSYIKKNTEIF